MRPVTDTTPEVRTLLTADLENFSSRMQADEAGLIRFLVDRYYNRVERVAAAHRGVLFRKEGDAVWCSFSRPIDGVRAAIALQKEMAALTQHQAPEARLRLRCGLHMGEVVLTKDGDMLGSVLTIAKRLESVCTPGGVLITEELYFAIGHQPVGASFEPRGEVELKGVGRRHVYQAMPVPMTGRGLGRWKVLAVDLGGLEGASLADAERDVLTLVQAQKGQLWLSDEGTALAALPPETPVQPLRLAGRRVALTQGEVLLAPAEEGLAPTLAGEAVERAREGLQLCGLELEGALLGEELVPSISGDVEPRSAGGATFYAWTPESEQDRSGSPLRARHQPRTVSAVLGGEVVDLTLGWDPALPPPAEGPLSSLHTVLSAWGLTGGAGVPGRRAMQVGGLVQSQLALGIAALAASNQFHIPTRTAAIGRLGPSGEVWPLPELEAREAMELLLRAGARAVLAPVGHRAWAPAGLHVVEVWHLGEAKAWLRQHTADPVLEGLARAQSEGQLVVAVGAPTDAELAGLRETLGVGEGELGYLAEEAEAELGQEGLEQALRGWGEVLPLGGWTAPLEELRPAALWPLFPDPRLPAPPDLPPRLTQKDRESALEAWIEPRIKGVRGPLLLLSHRVSDPWAHALLQARRVGSPQLPVVWCVDEATDPEVRFWARRGVTLRVGEAESLLEDVHERAFAKSERLARSRLSTGRPVPERPYKFLDPYGPEDGPIFFGRELEAEQVTARVLGFPLLVLFGKSGAGKTSLLRAGVLARLPRPAHLGLVLRVLGDPLKLLAQTLQSLLPRPQTDALALPALVERAAGALPGHLVIVLDQFEEFFVRLSRDERAKAMPELAALLRALPPRVHVVLCLREDFLADLAEFEPFLPTVLDNRFRLTTLTREQAERAIAGPAALFGVVVERALVDELVRELFEQGVDPPALQVVLEQLWRAKPAGEERLTLGQYRALGGARTLLVGHLRAALDEELKERAPLARKVLRAMVTDRSTKAVLTASRLALRSGLPADDVKPLLAELVRVRLVRTLPGEAEPLFELAHEFLISEVRSWAEEEGLSLTHARMVLRTELEHWGRFRVLLGPELLAVVAREQPRLHPSSAERAMLLRASAVHGQPIAGWLGQGAVERESVAVLLELLGQGALPGSAALGASAQRRIVEALFPLVLSEVAEGALLDAAERVAHRARSRR
jgi:class 3 adenylate cyclase